MSKSLYEKYAEEAQPEVLAKTVSLEDAVESIKGFKGRFSSEYLEWAEEICADIFGRTFEEVRDLVDGKQHWISIAGMYEKTTNKTLGTQNMSEFVEPASATQKSEKLVDGKNNINLDDYRYVNSLNGFHIYEKYDGFDYRDNYPVVIYAAKHQDGGEAFAISWEQSRGLKPIDIAPDKTVDELIGNAAERLQEGKESRNEVDFVK